MEGLVRVCLVSLVVHTQVLNELFGILLLLDKIMDIPFYLYGLLVIQYPFTFKLCHLLVEPGLVQQVRVA